MQAVIPDTGKAQRLFIALWPSQALCHAIARWQQAWDWPPAASLVAPQQLHITLHFLGNVPSHRLPELVQGLRVPFECFSLAFGQGTVWPGGLAVLQPDATPAPLARLHAALRDRLVGLNLPVDARPYRAHVTLARRAQGAKPPAQGPALSWPIDAGYVLVRSLPDGAGYDVIERFG